MCAPCACMASSRLFSMATLELLTVTGSGLCFTRSVSQVVAILRFEFKPVAVITTNGNRIQPIASHQTHRYFHSAKHTCKRSNAERKPLLDDGTAQCSLVFGHGRQARGQAFEFIAATHMLLLLRPVLAPACAARALEVGIRGRPAAATREPP